MMNPPSSSPNNMMSTYDIGKDEHEHDLVMPGFRFHPTEEELIKFYLRRKVEGKRFNVELITFLDLYRYDPWELPALAAIGEKEWFFYVPRDRKYRNGDRPNRVTTSGYWKATGADRMVRGEDSRSIGLKKTLVFYSGKAPKGIRTRWIMNEYRLPQSDTDRYQKAEISLCRVYKRPGVDDHYQLPGSLSSINKTSSSSSKQTQPNSTTTKVLRGASSSSSSSQIYSINKFQQQRGGGTSSINTLYTSSTSTEGDSENIIINNGGFTSLLPSNAINNFMVDTIQSFPININPSEPQLLPFNMVPISDKLWEWNLLHEAAGRDYTGFK